MYCIIGYSGYEKLYLAFQLTNNGFQYGYYLTDKETFMMNLSNNKKAHPTLFKTHEKAEEFIEWLLSKRPGFSLNGLSYEYIDSHEVPKCDMNCFRCNKRHIQM